MNSMKQKIIGVFSIGFEDIQLVLREGTGGEFFNWPGEGEIPRIKIGADYDKWKDVVAALLHEAAEFAMNRLRCRLNRDYDMGGDHSGYVFMMSHPEFSDVCARVADFLAASLWQLHKEWKAWKRQPKEKKKS